MPLIHGAEFWEPPRGGLSLSERSCNPFQQALSVKSTVCAMSTSTARVRRHPILSVY